MSPCLGLTLPILSLLPYCCGVIFLSHKSDYVLQSPSENPLGTPDSHRIKWALKHGVQRCGQKLPRLLPSPLWTSYFCSELPYPCWTTLAIFLRVPASFVPPYIWMHYPEDPCLPGNFLPETWLHCHLCNLSPQVNSAFPSLFPQHFVTYTLSVICILFCPFHLNVNFLGSETISLSSFFCLLCSRFFINIEWMDPVENVGLCLEESCHFKFLMLIFNILS